VLIRAGKSQLMRIERGTIVGVHVEHNQGQPALGSRRHQTAGRDRRIETQQGELWSQRVVERSPVA
jgi:hypothetical protein